MTDRREKVILELEDRFTRQMVQPIAATKALDAALDSLSDSAVHTSRDQDALRKSTEDLGDEVEKTSTKVREGARDIDRYSGRLRLLTEAALVLGPALIPIGAVGVPAVAALTAGLGAAVGAAGIAVLAFHGVGDTLKALNAYQLEPTAKNLEKLNAEMAALGPGGMEMVLFLDSLEPQLRGLQEMARAGLFPGVEAGITSLLALLPQVRRIVFDIATGLGALTARAGAGLAGAGFQEFFDYLETDAQPILMAFGLTLGHIAQGLASLMVAFGPLTGGFVSGMEAMTLAFAHWAAGLSQTDGFRDFVNYVRESGPQVLALLGALATAFIGILQAAAPVGEAVVPTLTVLAKILGTIAASPIGPPLFTAAVALMAVNRAATLVNATMIKLSGTSAAASRSIASIGAGLNFAAILASLTAVDKAMDKVFGDSSVDTANLGRNLDALASGHITANLADISSWLKQVNQSSGEFGEKVFDKLPGNLSGWGDAKANIDAIDEALAQMVETGNAETAAAAFEQIQQQVEKAGGNTAETTKWFTQYNTALKNAADSSDEATVAISHNANSLNIQGRMAQQAREKIAGLVAAMEEQTSAALAAFDAVTQYNRALDAAQKQAKKSEAGINASTEAGRKNRDALSQLASAWNNQSDAVRNNVAKWKDARAQFIKAADDMGVPIKKAEDLADRLMEIPQRVVTRIEAQSDPALQNILRIKRAIQGVPTEWHTRFYVTQMNAINKRGPFDAATGSADGSTVPKDGRSYADRYLYALAPGEEIISNRRGQADHYRPLLKAINAAADGSTVSQMLRHGSHSFRSGHSGAATSVSTSSLAGLRIEGHIEVDGRDGYLRGVIRDEIAAEKRFDNVKAGR